MARWSLFGVTTLVKKQGRVRSTFVKDFTCQELVEVPYDWPTEDLFPGRGVWASIFLSDLPSRSKKS